MTAQQAPWTMKEIAILKNGQMPRHQAPLLPGRSMAAIRQKRNDLGLTKKQEKPKHVPPTPTPKDAYRGKAVELYQFIKTSEATPARKKVWAQEERAIQTV